MSIRTTVTLDEDVLERTKEFSKKRGIPFRQALNDLIRTGLITESKPRPVRKFKVEPFEMGYVPGLNYDDIEGLLEYGEGEDHR